MSDRGKPSAAAQKVPKQPVDEAQSFPMTPAGYKRLCDEYDKLLKVERPQIVETVTWAASNGDRSENADYQYGKKRLKEIDRRVHYLEQRINQAKVIHTERIDRSKIALGASVLLEFDDGETKRYKLVGEDEIYQSSEGAMLISNRSPLGHLLEGKGVGEELLFRRPKGETLVTILEISYE